MNALPDQPGNNQFGTAGEALEIGARLQKQPSRQMIETVFQRELNDQLMLLETLNRVDLAHTLIMTESGIIPKPDALQLLGALLELQNQPADFNPEPSKGDLYTNRECWLIEHTPAGKWLGTGRARREAITTAYVLKQRDEIISLTEALLDLCQVLTFKAKDYMVALMPDYTYLQKAQPTSFGHYLLGFTYPLLRDIERIIEFYSRLNQSPAGCGSSNGSRINQSREQLSQLLGFDGLIQHARDAMWQADLQIEIVALLTTLHINLDRLAEDLQIFMSEEFGLLEIDDQHARASKIMPQKKNPFALTHIRGMANTMIGQLTSCAALGRTPSGQPDNRLSLYGMIPRSLIDSKNSILLMQEIIALMKFNTHKGRAKLLDSFALATDLAEVLVQKRGLSFREAHRLVGVLTRNHQKQGNFSELNVKELADTSEELLGQRIELNPSELSVALDPVAAISARNQTGSTAVSSMCEMIVECRQTLGEARIWSTQKQSQIAASEDRLKQKINHYLISSTGD